MNTVIYTRVSTNVQDYQRQIEELQQFASSHDWNVLQVFSEKVSGAKKNEERQELSKMLDYINNNNKDVLFFKNIINLINEMPNPPFILK